MQRREQLLKLGCVVPTAPRNDVSSPSMTPSFKRLGKRPLPYRMS